MYRALGRLPDLATERPVLHFGNYLTGAHQRPSEVDNFALIEEWDDYHTFEFGLAVPAALAYTRSQATRYLGSGEVRPTQSEVVGVYTSCNPDFDPVSHTGDRGAVIADALDVVMERGFGGVTPACYLKVDATSYEEVHSAIALCGSVILGVELDLAQNEQFDASQPWDYARRSTEWGPHAVLAGSYTGSQDRGQPDITVLTWGQRQGCTDDFMARQLTEAWVLIWPETLLGQAFRAGVDVVRLAGDYTELTGREFGPAVKISGTQPPPMGPRSFEDDLRAFMASAQGWLDGARDE